MDYYITRQKEDKSDEKIMEISGSKEDAYKAFDSVIRAQAVEYHEKKTLKYWPVLTLFDSYGNIIGRES